MGCVVGDHERRLVLGVAVGLAPDPVDRAVAGGRGQPAAGVGRYAVTGPPLDGRQQRLAGRLLGDVDVAEAADQRGDDAAVLLAVDPLDRSGGVGRVHPRGQAGSAWKGRTSTLPWQAFDASVAHCEGGVEVGQLEDPEAADPLLGLGERAVGDDRLGAGVVDGGRDVDRLETAAEHPDAGVHHLLVDRVHGLEDRLHRPPGRTRGSSTVPCTASRYWVISVSSNVAGRPGWLPSSSPRTAARDTTPLESSRPRSTMEPTYPYLSNTVLGTAGPPGARGVLPRAARLGLPRRGPRGRRHLGRHQAARWRHRTVVPARGRSTSRRSGPPRAAPSRCSCTSTSAWTTSSRGREGRVARGEPGRTAAPGRRPRHGRPGGPPVLPFRSGRIVTAAQANSVSEP